MKAVVITKPGGVEVLEVRDVPTPPEPTADRVRVRVHTAALNRADLLQRLGRYPAPPGSPADIPGLEFAGEVDAIGPEVRTWRAGQRVFGIAGGGAQAEFITLPENHIAEIPASLDWIEAAAIPEAFMTAHDALFTQANLRMGESLLVHAAGSGVGTAAIQLAHAAGATVFGTARTPEKLSRARRYGLDGSVVVDEDLSVVTDSVRAWTSGRGVDVVLDLVGAAYFESNIHSLAAQGRLLLVGTPSGSKATIDHGVVMSKRLQIIGTVLRARSAEEKAAVTRRFAQEVVPLLAAETIEAVVDSTFKMKEVREAHHRLESNDSFGKIVLIIS